MLGKRSLIKLGPKNNEKTEWECCLGYSIFLGLHFTRPIKTVLHFQSQPLKHSKQALSFFRGPQSCRCLVRKKEALDVNRNYRPTLLKNSRTAGGETWVQLRGKKSDLVLQGLRGADGKLRYVAFMIVNYVNLKNSTSIAVAV